MMHRIATTEKDSHGFVIPYAEFHVGKAYFQGYGVPESEAQAERLLESETTRFSSLSLPLVGGFRQPVTRCTNP